MGREISSHGLRSVYAAGSHSTASGKWNFPVQKANLTCKGIEIQENNSPNHQLDKEFPSSGTFVGLNQQSAGSLWPSMD